MSNQDIDGSGRAAEATGTPESLAQQLEKEREARAQMRDRLRNTEALAAESHALRERMASELERVTAERDRLRSAAANAPAANAAAGTAKGTSSLPPEVPLPTPHAVEWPLRPPAPPARSGPWRALAMLGALAAAIAAFAWFTGSLPGGPRDEAAAASAPQATQPSAPRLAAASEATPARPALALAASPPTASNVPPTPGAVALPPLTPEQHLAAAPSAAGPTPVAPTPLLAAAAAPSIDVAARLRRALDGEGIASPVEVDAATGHVLVADPQSDHALRDRTDLVIRAVYVGAGQPEPQIEHRWLSPKRGEHAAPVATTTPTAARDEGDAAAAAYAARHATPEHHRKGADKTVADAEELRPVVPAGRITADCMASLSGKSGSRRAALTACMKHSCCSAGNHGADECRAYSKAYPFTCSAG